jgi:hypothetical protein
VEINIHSSRKQQYAVYDVLENNCRISSWGGVRLSPLCTSVIIWPTVWALDVRWWWWLWSSLSNENWRRKPPTVPLFPPQISHDLTWDWTRDAEVGNR